MEEGLTKEIKELSFDAALKELEDRSKSWKMDNFP